MSQNPVTPWIKTTCAYCGVGCGIEAKPQRNGSVLVRGDDSHPANLGKLCSKGLALGETLVEAGRLRYPLVNKQRVSWDSALTTVAQRFSETIEKHGPDSVAFYLSGQLLTEDYYVANKLMKGFIGSSNVDTNSRLCMSSSVAGHQRAFGSDSVPACYQDIEAAQLIVLVGSNLAWCHPILFQRIKAARAQNPKCKLVVIDPRVTASCSEADLHLDLDPGKDVLLFNSLLKYLANNHLVDQDYIDTHTDGFDAALQSADSESKSIEECAERLGITTAKLEQFYRLFSQTEKVLTLYSQGVNQSSQGTDKVNSIINCHLATGKVGKPGSNPFSITGQPNAMGGREVGGLAHTLTSHLGFNEPSRQLVADYWQTDNLACKPGLKAVDMFDAIASGKIKAVWIMATNPAVSLPGSNKIKAALAQCPLVVVSDCVSETDTQAFAHVQLPAQGWSEKSGTVTNSERRISRQRRITVSPGEARADWWIICEIAKRMGFARGFNYRHEAQIFREYAQLTRKAHELTKHSLNLSGLAELSDTEYHNMTPQQWPVTAKQTMPTHQHLFGDGKFDTPNQRAQLIPVTYQPSPQTLTSQYPLRLNNGRNRDQWHTMTRTGLSPRLSSHQAEPVLQISPVDAAHYQLKDNDIAQISSLAGSAIMRVLVSNSVKPGDLFAPIHWSGSNSYGGKISTLGQGITDPISGQPEMKSTPVNLKRYQANSQALVVCRRELPMQGLNYWVKQTVKDGFCYFIASDHSAADLNRQLQQLSPTRQTMRISTEQSDQSGYRFAASDANRIEFAYTLSANLNFKQYTWLEGLLNADTDQTALLISLLSASPQGELSKGKIICACKQVGENQLSCAIREQGAKDVASLTSLTQAGSGCGSCIPELAEMLETYRLEDTMS